MTIHAFNSKNLSLHKNPHHKSSRRSSFYLSSHITSVCSANPLHKWTEVPRLFSLPLSPARWIVGRAESSRSIQRKRKTLVWLAFIPSEYLSDQTCIRRTPRRSVLGNVGNWTVSLLFWCWAAHLTYQTDFWSYCWSHVSRSFLSLSYLKYRFESECFSPSLIHGHLQTFIVVCPCVHVFSSDRQMSSNCS